MDGDGRTPPPSHYEANGSQVNEISLSDSQYLHVKDRSKNSIRVVCGPQTFICGDNEDIVFGPHEMTVIPPDHYCVVRNPVILNAENNLECDETGGVRLNHEYLEVRLQQEQFPLYPGEILHIAVSPLTHTSADFVSRLRALCGFEDLEMNRIPAEEWQYEKIESELEEGIEYEDDESEIEEQSDNEITETYSAEPCNGTAGESGDLGMEKAVTTREDISTDSVSRSNSPVLLSTGEVPQLKEQEVDTGVNEVSNLTALLDTEDKRDKSGIEQMSGEKTGINLSEAVEDTDVKEHVYSDKVITPLVGMPTNVALRLRARSNFRDGEINRVAGEEWLFKGTGTYLSRKEVEVVETVSAVYIKPNEAIKLVALADIKDKEGINRVTGEEWIVKETGTYLPGAYEKIIDEKIKAHVLTENEAIHVKATHTFVDEFGKPRKNGDEWLITNEDTKSYIPGVYEDVQGPVNITTLRKHQYCVVLNPADENGNLQLGSKKLVKGEKSFFLLPGESLESIKDACILSENEGLILKAREAFEDTHIMPPITRKPGEQWMIQGPIEYIPPIEVEVFKTRTARKLSDDEGIYILNTITGQISLKKGKYIRNEDEEEFVKLLPPAINDLIKEYLKVETQEKEFAPAITFNVPHNSCVQIHDYLLKNSRVVFGPDLVMLEPNELPTVLSLSGEKPKRPNVIQTLFLQLGPDFCTDIIAVETIDHVRLSLTLSYGWYFDAKDKSREAGSKLFSIPDFVGFFCKKFASRIRDVISSNSYQDFHEDSTEYVRNAIFGLDEEDPNEKFSFPENNLCITSVTVQAVDIVDKRVRDSLERSARVAFEETTRHQAALKEQAFFNELEIKRILKEIETETSIKNNRKEKEKDENKNKVDNGICSEAKIEALCRMEAQKIENKDLVDRAREKADAMKLETDRELKIFKRLKDYIIGYTTDMNNEEMKKYRDLSNADIEKVKSIIQILNANKTEPASQPLLSQLIRIAFKNKESQLKLMKGFAIESAKYTSQKVTYNLCSVSRRNLEVLSAKNKHLEEESDESEADDGHSVK